MAVATLGNVVLNEQVISGETFISLSEDAWLVKSGSQDGAWYSITLWAGRVSSCSCKGWQFRSDCRHARAFASQGQAECSECGHLTHHHVDGQALCCECASARG
jgi:hypothetical protein